MSEHRVALVTGGSLGIGQAAIAALAPRGYAIAALARGKAGLEAAIDALDEAARQRVIAVPADVTREAEVKAAVDAVIERFGRLDVLINCAGGSMSARRRLADSTSAEWHRLIDVNLTGTYLMCRTALPYLEKSEDAYILNVQSTASYAAQPGVSLYAASKYGVRALTEALIEEYRNSAVRITSVSPGPVDTNIWSHKVEPPSDSQRALMMRPADIADIFMWLLERPRRLHIPNITVTPWTGFA